MTRTISIKYLLLVPVTIFVLATAIKADPLRITIGPGANGSTFTFVNAHPTETARDFSVILLTPPPPAIRGGFGGVPFPVTTLLQPADGGGFFAVNYSMGNNGTGIAPGGLYTHIFPGWPVGTQFEVQFSYIINGQAVLLDPTLAVVVGATSQGQTTPTPEPTTLLLLGTGLAGVAVKIRKGLKNRKQ